MAALPTLTGSLAYAPISKGCMLVVGLTSTLAGIFNQQGLFNVPLSPHLVRDWQFWRLLSSQSAFAHSAELLFGMLLLFNCGVTLEKFFGSVKFGSFLVVSWFFSSVLALVALLLFSTTGYAALPAGPVSLIFAMLYQYHKAVPATYHFEIFGGHFSNKSFLYFFALQLLSCQPKASVLPAITGVLASALIRSDILGMRQFTLPLPIIRLASYLSPLLGSNRIPRRSARTTPEAPQPQASALSGFSPFERAAGSARRQQATAAAANPDGTRTSALQEWRTAFSGTAQARPLQVDRDAVSNLQAMFPGTTPQAAEEALRNSNNDVNRAVEALLANAS